MKFTVTTIDTGANRKEISLFQAWLMLNKKSKEDRAVYVNDPAINFHYYSDLIFSGEVFFEGWMQFVLNRIPETIAEERRESGEWVLDAEYWNEPY
jgi:hypothetical protein